MRLVVVKFNLTSWDYVYLCCGNTSVFLKSKNSRNTSAEVWIRDYGRGAVPTPGCREDLVS